MSELWDAAVRECGTEVVSGYAQPVIVLSSPQAVADLAGAVTQDQPNLSATLSVMLWLYRRLPRAYGRPPQVEQPILAVARQLGNEDEVRGYLAERGE